MATRVRDLEEERRHFDRLRQPIEAALLFAGGTHTLEDVWAMIAESKAQLWWGAESVIITEIDQTPRKKILHFFLAGGNLQEIAVMYEMVADWGRDIGCDRAVIVGRKGWARTFLKEDGWKPAHTVFAKEL